MIDPADNEREIRRRTKNERILLIMIGSFLQGLAGPWSKSSGLQFYIVGLTSLLIAHFTFWGDEQSRHKMRFKSLLTAIGICTITSIFAGGWHISLCQALPFARQCDIYDIEFTVFTSLILSNVMILMLAVASLFYKRR